VLGRSFARIFFRNCINLGLPAISCGPAADAAGDGAMIRIAADQGSIEVDEQAFETAPLPTFICDMIRHGGLEAWVRNRLASARRGIAE
jgi:3-isopropylmalate/(R)-2-methylmalate dehydratase small subunit